MTQPIISMKSVSKSFGSFKALCDINLEVSEGEVVVIIGPSGSGKSTLIRCINLLEQYDQGDIYVDGIRVQNGSNLRKVRSEVGMLFQQFNLFPHMTTLRNVALAPMRVRHLSKAAAEERAMKLLDRVNVVSVHLSQVSMSLSDVAPPREIPAGLDVERPRTAWLERRWHASQLSMCQKERTHASAPFAPCSDAV